jgi:3-oxoacyl-[acyl-carrier protein] reductase
LSDTERTAIAEEFIELIDDVTGKVAPMTASHIDSITPAIPLKRVGDPDEIAGLVAYLASGESGYMTGSSLTIDGGMAL